MKKISKKKDKQVQEFEKRDLGKDILHSRAAVTIRPKTRQMSTSILLDPATIDRLKDKATRRGIGYQTMLKIIVHEHLNEY